MENESGCRCPPQACSRRTRCCERRSRPQAGGRGIEIERCVRCGGRLQVIASIEEPELIERILAHRRERGEEVAPTASLWGASAAAGVAVLIQLISSTGSCCSARAGAGAARGERRGARRPCATAEDAAATKDVTPIRHRDVLAPLTQWPLRALPPAEAQFKIPIRHRGRGDRIQLRRREHVRTHARRRSRAARCDQGVGRVHETGSSGARAAREGIATSRRAGRRAGEKL